MGKEAPEITTRLGANVVRERTRRGLDQAELAKRAGTSPTTLSSIENGKAATNLALLERIAAALDCEPWQLLKPESAESAPSPVSPRLAAIGEAVTILCTLNEFELDGVTAFLRGVAGTDAAASAPLAPRARKAK
jgi:transcriptional regulator with XRE-family HTH domain